MKAFAILLAIFAVASAKRFFHRDQVLRLNPQNKLQLQVIETLQEKYPIDFWTDLQGTRPVDIHVQAKDLAAVKTFLAYNRINFQIFIEDLQVAIDDQVTERAVQLDLSSFDYNVYHPLDEINKWIDDMEQTYSTVTKYYYPGISYEGREMPGLKISAGASSCKPAFLINCGLHSREWVAPASCMYAVKYFVEAKPGSEEYNLLQDVDIYVTPISNPDGYVYTWTTDRMWRKTRSDNNKVCMGVDPNRNWDINWSGEGASASACSEAYYGPSPMSESEVQAQADFLKSIPNLQGYIDVHAYSQYWMYPYAYQYGQCADYAFLGQVAQECSQAIYNVHSTLYFSGSISTVIYVASGSTADYVYDTVGVKCSFAAELRDDGRYGFTLPEAFIQPTAEETFAGLKVIASYVASGQCRK